MRENPLPLRSPILNQRLVYFAALCSLSLGLQNANALVVGGAVPDRATLNSILAGYGPVTETFEAIPFPAVGQVIPPVLNNAASVYGFGSGLVVPGITFLDPTLTQLQWNGGGYYGQPSNDLNSNTSTLEIDFSHPARAFGLDMTVFAGFGDNANVNVYAVDNLTLLASFSGIPVNDPSSPVFFGYQDPGGIGKVEIQGASRGWSPMIDNVTFAPVPEPSAMALAALGLVALARRSR